MDVLLKTQNLSWKNIFFREKTRERANQCIACIQHPICLRRWESIQTEIQFDVCLVILCASLPVCSVVFGVDCIWISAWPLAAEDKSTTTMMTTTTSKSLCISMFRSSLTKRLWNAPKAASSFRRVPSKNGWQTSAINFCRQPVYVPAVLMPLKCLKCSWMHFASCSFHLNWLSPCISFLITKSFNKYSIVESLSWMSYIPFGQVFQSTRWFSMFCREITLKMTQNMPAWLGCWPKKLIIHPWRQMQTLRLGRRGDSRYLQTLNSTAIKHMTTINVAEK